MPEAESRSECGGRYTPGRGSTLSSSSPLRSRSATICRISRSFLLIDSSPMPASDPYERDRCSSRMLYEKARSFRWPFRPYMSSSFSFLLPLFFFFLCLGRPVVAYCSMRYCSCGKCPGW